MSIIEHSSRQIHSRKVVSLSASMDQNSFIKWYVLLTDSIYGYTTNSTKENVEFRSNNGSWRARLGLGRKVGNFHPRNQNLVRNRICSIRKGIQQFSLVTHSTILRYLKTITFISNSTSESDFSQQRRHV